MKHPYMFPTIKLSRTEHGGYKLHSIVITEDEYNYWKEQMEEGQSINAYYYYCTEFGDEKDNIVEEAMSMSQEEFTCSLPTLPDALADELYQAAKHADFSGTFWATILHPYIDALELEVFDRKLWMTILYADNWQEYQKLFHE